MRQELRNRCVHEEMAFESTFFFCESILALFLGLFSLNRYKSCKNWPRLITLILMFGAGNVGWGQTTYYSRGNANWDVNTNWSTTAGGASCGCTPGANDNVIIRNDHTVTMNVTTTVNSITVGEGTSGILQGLAGTGVTLTLNGSLTVSAGGTLRATGGTANNTTTINIAGNLTNNGTLTTTATAGSGANARRQDIDFVLNGTSNQQIGGTATTTFQNLTISNTNNSIVTLNTNCNIASGKTLTLSANSFFTAGAGIQINSAGANGIITGNGTLEVTRTTATADFATQYRFSTYTTTNLSVHYVGAGNQSVNAYTYGSLLVGGSGTKTLAGNTTVNGNITVRDGSTLDRATRTLATPTSITLENVGGSNGGRIIGSANLTLGGNITVNYSGSGAITAAAEIAGPVVLGATRTVTVNDDATNNSVFIFSGVVSGTNFGITKSGTGTLLLTGANTYTGATTINAGILRLGAADIIANTSNLILNGGTFSTGSGAGFAETIGTLQVTENSTIELGTGSHNLNFANSSGVSWTAGKTLTITGWTGSIGASGTSGKVFFGTSNTTLTSTQLSNILFTGFTGSTGSLLSTGECVPSCPSIPTPTVSTQAATCSAAGTATVSNYNVAYSYTFSPTGPTVGSGGAISSLTPGTNYTVTANLGACSSSASSSFSVAAQFTTPSVPTISTTAATCSAAGTATVTNYDAGLTYTFSPTGPSVGGGGAISGMVAGTTYTVTAGNGSCTSTSSASFSIAAQLSVPAAVTASGAGTFCNSTTVTASGGAGGTIYWQGTTPNGTSTATASTSQSVTASGTYYFRSRSSDGCWGEQGSVTVTINNDNTVGSPSSNPSLCTGVAMATNVTISTTGATGIGTPSNFPPGLSANFASNTITISGTPTTQGTYNYSIPLTGGCGSVNASGTITVTNSLGTVGTINGTATKCEGLTGQIYTIDAPDHASTYSWSVPAGWNITAGQGTNQIEVTVGSGGQNGNISVTINGANGCGSATRDLSVTSIVCTTPVLSVSPLTAFGNVCVGTEAGPNSFVITGTNLDAGTISVGALSGYTYSTTSGGTYTSTLSLSQSGGAYSQEIFVKLAASAAQSYNGKHNRLRRWGSICQCGCERNWYCHSGRTNSNFSANFLLGC
jgi:hypothetical protein